MMTQPEEDPFRSSAAAAIADVEALGLSGEDRGIVLRVILEARLGSSRQAHRPDPSLGEGSSNKSAPAAPVAEGDLIGQIASGLGLSRDTVDLVYTLDGDQPQIVLSAKKISANKAIGTRQLGQLLAAARQLARLEEWTSAAAIRKVVTDYGRLDSSNFAATLQQMDSVALIRGKGQQREVKITKPGIEATAELIKQLLGSDS